jgi:hypothetical protein
MTSYNLFHEALGRPEHQIVPPASFYQSKAAKIDEELVALWREDGWAGYAKGLLWTVNPEDFADLHKDWPVVPRRASVFARSAFGNLFLLDKGEVFLLSIQGNRLMTLGPSVNIFFNSTLLEADLREPFLDEKLFKSVRRRAGDLAADECYGLFPALPLGGDDEDPKNYRRVKLREYLATLAQLHS